MLTLPEHAGLEYKVWIRGAWRQIPAQPLTFPGTQTA